MREYYFDNAAATPPDPAILLEINRGMKFFGNPSAYNDAGRKAARELSRARETVARFLGTHADEIVFTASGSESNSLALFGVSGQTKKQNEILTTAVEHSSVLEPLRVLEKTGYAVRRLPVDEQGRLDASAVERAITGKTLLVSVMYANNEIGTVEPIVQIGKAVRRYRQRMKGRFPLFHTDACQAAAYLPMNVNHLGVDLLTFNGSKLYGPRGTGVLYVKRGVELRPLIRGGGQESGLRAGTENLPAIMGLAKAVTLIHPRQAVKIGKLRDAFLDEIQRRIPGIRINGPRGDNRLANNIHLSLPGLESEALLLELDSYGIRAASGSACSAHSVEPSHVLKAIGTKKPYLFGPLRLTLGKFTEEKDIAYLLRILPKAVADLRRRYSR